MKEWKMWQFCVTFPLHFSNLFSPEWWDKVKWIGMEINLNVDLSPCHSVENVKNVVMILHRSLIISPSLLPHSIDALSCRLSMGVGMRFLVVWAAALGLCLCIWRSNDGITLLFHQFHLFLSNITLKIFLKKNFKLSIGFSTCSHSLGNPISLFTSTLIHFICISGG